MNCSNVTDYIAEIFNIIEIGENMQGMQKRKDNNITSL